jgi:hypothetical protein
LALFFLYSTFWRYCTTTSNKSWLRERRGFGGRERERERGRGGGRDAGTDDIALPMAVLMSREMRNK